MNEKKNGWTKEEMDYLHENYPAPGEVVTKVRECAPAKMPDLSGAKPMNTPAAGNPKYKYFPAPAEIDLSYLIEDWQCLMQAIRDRDWEAAQVTADCLAELINKSAHDNPELQFQPCALSLVNMGDRAGVLAKPDGTDFTCAAGCPVHGILCGETEQCSDECKQKHGCDPARGTFLMASGHMYDGDCKNSEQLLDALEQA